MLKFGLFLILICLHFIILEEDDRVVHHSECVRHRLAAMGRQLQDSVAVMDTDLQLVSFASRLKTTVFLEELGNGSIAVVDRSNIVLCSYKGSSLVDTSIPFYWFGGGVFILCVVFIWVKLVRAKVRDDSDWHITIGNMKMSKTVIGAGSNGTQVFRGLWDGREVAVKRIQKGFERAEVLAEREKQYFISASDCCNVLQLYGTESCTNFWYICLELCDRNLEDLITSSNRNQHGFTLDAGLHKIPTIDMQNLIRGIVEGLKYLHEIGIIHRDLKPQNVLLKGKTVKLADLGSAKVIGSGNNTIGCGSVGWQAPELIKKRIFSYSSDSFSLGCIIYYCLNEGKHPFGAEAKRESNIKEFYKRKVIRFVDYKLRALENPEAKELVKKLICYNPAERISPRSALSLPFFWTSETRFEFFRLASDQFKKERIDVFTIGPAEQYFEAKANLSLNWRSQLTTEFNNYLKPYYDTDKKYWLLRAVRNTWGHFMEMNQAVQAEFKGSSVVDVDLYFREKYPELLMETRAVAQQFWPNEPLLLKYL